jgi:hypothetical protein
VKSFATRVLGLFPKSHPLLLSLTCLAVFGSAPRVHAASIPWSYTWSRRPIFIIDNHGTGGIALTSEPWRRANGRATVVATNLIVFSSAFDRLPDHISKRSYALTLTIKDNSSGKRGSLKFTGMFNGTLSTDTAHIANYFTGKTRQWLHLGNYWYTVTMGPYVAPQPNHAGMIEARVTVQHNPEPASWVLAGMAALLASGVAWRQWARRKRALAGPRAC